MLLRPRGLVAAILLLLSVPRLAAQGRRLDAPTALRIDSVFSRFTVPGSPGCALGVILNGTLVYARGYGLASVELGVPITPATVFDIGSVSKQFTAMAIVLLAQDGKLALDDEIQKYLPELPRYSKPVTIRHLLHHTSGIRDYIDLLAWSGAQEESVTGDREALEIIARQQAPNFEAGAEYLYSNSGFFLLSIVVRRVSGRPLRQFAAERIFGPLGMTHTFYLDDHAEIVPAKAGSYAPRGRGAFRLALANWEQTGDGGVQTTVEDLLQWDRNFSSGAVGGQAAIRELETPGVLNSGKPIDYALGLNVDNYRGLRRVAHGGSWAGFRAQLTRFPGQATSISTLCNVSNAAPGVLATRVADVLLAAELGPASVTIAVRSPAADPTEPAPARPLRDYVGRYHSDELFTDWVITQAGDSLRFRIGPLYEETVELAGGGTSVAGTSVRFLEARGNIVGLSLTSRGARDFRLARMLP